MHDTTPKFTPHTHTVFGEFYVREQHNDTADQHLPPSEVDRVIKSLKASMFREVLKSLRSALATRRQP
jgi:hypothetical protein